MTLNNEHHKNELDKIGSILRKDQMQEITDKAKNELLDVFLESESKLENPEQVESVFEHIKKLVEYKEVNARREDMKIKRKKIGEFIKDIKSKYDTGPQKDAKTFFGQLKSIYLKEIAQKEITQKEIPNSIPDKKDIEIKSQQEQIDELKKRLEQLENPNNQITPEKTKAIEVIDQKPTLDGTIKNTQKEITNLFSMDANLMDKENLIYESERNRIRDLSERKYESANRFGKFGMFTTDRWRQRRRLNNSINQARENSNFIETGTLQQRIEGNIGTYVNQETMGIENNNIESRENLGSDDRINNISHAYLMGTISEADTIRSLNTAFADLYRTRGDIQNLGDMTGTDIMSQLKTVKNNPNKQEEYIIYNTLMKTLGGNINSVSLSDTQLTQIKTKLPNLSDDNIRTHFENLKAKTIKDSIGQMNEKTTKINITLRGMIKKEDTEELEGVKYNQIDKGFISGLSKLTSKLGLPGSIALKIVTGAGITALGGAPLFALAGVTGLGMILQYLKTYRDSTREIAKTHEDGINLGMPELDRRIQALENDIDNASGIQKIGARFGRNALHRQRKQKTILLSLQEMRQNDTMVSADQLMFDLDNPRPTYHGGDKSAVLASILARIDTGHEYDTQFITTAKPDGSDGGRELTAIKRNSLMNKIKETAILTPITLRNPDGSVQFDSIGNPMTISVSETSTPPQRTQYRQAIKSSESYTDTTRRLSDAYEQVQKDIKSGRNKLSANAAGNYLKNSALAAVATAGVKTTIDYLNQTPTIGEGITTSKEVGEQAEFKLSGHQTGDMTAHNETINTLHNGDNIADAKIEVAVDGVAAKTGAFSHYLTEANKISTEIGSMGLDPTTTATLQKALDPSQLKAIMIEGAKHGADIGNQKLLTLRWTEAIEHFADNLKAHNLDKVVVNNISFDDSISTMTIQASKTGVNNVSNRAFELIAEVTNTTTGEVSKLPRHTFIPDRTRGTAVLPFSNTYSKSGNDKWAYNIYNDGKNKKRRQFRDKKSKSSKEIIKFQKQNEEYKETLQRIKQSSNYTSPENIIQPVLTEQENLLQRIKQEQEKLENTLSHSPDNQYVIEQQLKNIELLKKEIYTKQQTIENMIDKLRKE